MVAAGSRKAARGGRLPEARGLLELVRPRARSLLARRWSSSWRGPAEGRCRCRIAQVRCKTAFARPSPRASVDVLCAAFGLLAGASSGPAGWTSSRIA